MAGINLVCGIIATHGEATNSRSCDGFKEQWLKVIEKNKKINNVEFYFLYCSPDVKEVTIKGMDFIVPGEESVANIIIKTVYFFKYVLENKKECSHVLRTNLSSFYNFPLLLEKLESLPKSKLVLGSKGGGNAGRPSFPSGSGTVYSIDVITKIGEYYKDGMKDVTRKGRRGEDLVIRMDDMIMGALLAKYKIGITHLPYVNLQRLCKFMSHIKDFVDEKKIKSSPTRNVSFRPWFTNMIKNENKIHYRCSNPDFEFIFEKLMERYY